MTKPTDHPAQPPSMDCCVDALLHDARNGIRHCHRECEQRVRESPTKAVLAAMAAGYCLHRLPLRTLLVAQARLAVGLAPPALLLLGAAKACDLLQRREADLESPRSE